MDFSFDKKRFSSPWFAFILIGLGVLVIYSNISKSPFVFDDLSSIVENKTIKDLSNFSSLSKLLKPRAIVDFTFALNYRVGKLNVFGYHLVNVLIHILNGFLVYLLVVAILKQLPGSSGFSNPSISRSADFSISATSLFAALIFVVHPIQTQAVTYTVQRYASVAAMFYMAAVLGYLKARMIQQRAGSIAPGAKSSAQGDKEKDQNTSTTFQVTCFYALSVLAGLLAFLSKQNTASLPLAILLVEYLLIDGTWQEWKQKLPWFAISFGLWILFIFYVSGLFSGGVEGRGLLEDVSGLMKETKAVGRWQYLCTQFNVIVIYIRLLLVPVRQNLDRLYPFKSGFFDAYTPFAFLFLIGFAALGTWHLKKRPIISLAIFWFFITLSVESSIIPIRDALFEHRLYIPMFGFALITAYLLFDLLFDLLSKKQFQAIIISVAMIMLLGVATYHRNNVWKNDITLWSDVVSKSSYNYRAHNNLGLALANQGKIAEAISHYSEALRINPNYAIAHNNIGDGLDKKGRINEAIDHYLQALREKPDFEEAHENLGNVFLKQDKVSEAVEQFNAALRINPEFTAAYNSLAVALIRMGKTDEALAELQKALQINPGDADTQVNLGSALLSLGRVDEAMVHFRKALQIKPDIPEVHSNLGVVLASSGKVEEAITHFRKALQIDPDNAQAFGNLNKTLAVLKEIDANIVKIKQDLKLKPEDPVLNFQLGDMYRAKGETDEAINYYQQATLLQPEFAEAVYHLAKLYIDRNEYEKALSLYQKMLTFLPDNPAVYYNIACIYARQNRSEESVAWLKKAVEKGFDDWKHIKIDKDLDNIRGSLPYQEFVKGH